MIKKLIIRSISLRLYSRSGKVGDSWPVLVICFFLFIPTMIYSNEIHGNTQIGYIPEIEGYEAEINLQYIPWKFLELSVGISILMDASNRNTFNPYRDTYSIQAKLNITDVIYISAYHHCVHPVWSTEEQFWDKFEGGNKTLFAIGLNW